MATGTGSQVLDDLAAALGCSVSTVDDDEDSLVSAPATKTCPPSPGGVEATPGDGGHDLVTGAETSESSSSSTVETLQPRAAARSSRTWLPVPVAMLPSL